MTHQKLQEALQLQENILAWKTVLHELTEAIENKKPLEIFIVAWGQHGKETIDENSNSLTATPGGLSTGGLTYLEYRQAELKKFIADAETTFQNL